METNRKLAIVCSFVLLLCLADNSWAAYTWAYASVTDGTLSYANSDTDNGFPGCTSYASISCGACVACGASASTRASAYLSPQQNGLPLPVENVTTNNNVVAGHDCYNDGTADLQMVCFVKCGQVAIANFKLNLETVSLSIAQGDPKNMHNIDVAVMSNGSTVTHGSFSLAANGAVSGTGFYDPGNFEVNLKNGNWTAEYIGPETVNVELPANTFFDLSFKTIADCNMPEPVLADANEPSYTTQHVSLAFPEGSEIILLENDSLVTHLKMDDVFGDTAADSSPGVFFPEGFFPAELSKDTGAGEPQWKIGKMGGGLRFEGDPGALGQYLTISEPNLPPLDSFTIAFWMKPKNMTGPLAEAAIVERSDNAGKGFLITKLQQLNGEMQFRVGSGDPNTMTVEHMYEPNQWVHIAWTFEHESNTQKVYKNGRLVQSDSDTRGRAHAPGWIRLAKSIISHPQNQYNGLLDNFQIFNYAQNAKQITQLLCSGPITSDLNLDCEVNLLDFSIFTSEWLKCNLLAQDQCGN